MVWSNRDAAHVICAMYVASIIDGEPRIDEESLELRHCKAFWQPESYGTDDRLSEKCKAEVC